MLTHLLVLHSMKMKSTIDKTILYKHIVLFGVEIGSIYNKLCDVPIPIYRSIASMSTWYLLRVLTSFVIGLQVNPNQNLVHPRSLDLKADRHLCVGI